MASNRPAQPTSFAPNDPQTFGHVRGDDEGPWEEWNPTADSIAPVRGRHRVSKQRGGGLARSSTVLGVGVLAAVGAGGIATASPGKPPVSISLPDLSSVTQSAKALISDGGSSAPKGSSTPLTGAGLTTADAAQGNADAGEALRARIMEQAESQQDQVDSAAQAAAETAAAKKAVALAAEQQDEAKAKEAAAKKKADAEAKQKAEAARLAELAKSYSLPTSSYTLTSRFGDAGSMWSSGYHTGLDFAAPTGTLIKAIHSGTVTEAGWAGAYGYRTILTLDDGTELWFCHQSSISVSVGQKVATGDVIGRVGATGNVTGPHLHLEVHPDGGAAIDPMAWLHSKGINP
ncbi:M23 family metallopeptidase [Streptomyces sp. NPDC059466]|uniref:M23 family metallopeptidase n=1 Tax=unclassified Streptomyces TaxID=2593676 RepID=UPI00368B3D5B